MFYIERNGGRRFNVVKPNSIRDEKKDPNTAILPLLTWLTVTESANSKTSSAFMVGLCWSAQSSFCVLVSLCSTSFPSQKSPVGLFFFLHKSYQFQNTHGVLQWCLKVVDSVRLFFFQTSMWIHKHLLPMEETPKSLSKNSPLRVIYYRQSKSWCLGLS